MAVRTKEELMDSIRARIGDDQSDEAIALVEDVSDTFDDMQSKANGGGEDWKKKYEDNDNAWRQRYKERFFNSDGKGDDFPDKKEEEDDKPLTYENLFKED